MRQLVRMAWRNLWRNWRRTAIALVAMVLGLILLVFFDGLMRGADQAIFGNAVRLYGGNILVHAPGFREKARRMPLLPLADADAVVAAARARPGVVAAGKRIITAGMITSREGTRSVVITGVEPDVERPIAMVAEHMAQGRYLLGEDEQAILIGRTLAGLLAVTVGDRVSLLGRGTSEAMRQESMTVVGVYDLAMPDAEKTMVYIPLPEAQTLYRLPGQATEVAVSLERVGQEAEVMSALKADLAGYEVDAWDTLRPEMRETLNTKMAFTTMFGFVVILIASIGILNLMLMAVFERTREMGVLAALGMKGRQVMGLFLLEGTLIGVLGAVIGGILGIAMNALAARVGIDISYATGMGEISALMGSRLYPATDLVHVVGRAVTVALIAMLASIYPAWLASRRQPAEVLHHV